ncbi:hypothetical protein CO015_03275 [candidate division WWE3 bacterium CG_4_8_14_3_um_filter_42_11]|uniref:Uncharacterized protein n=1 Tax=candidate division WWE3 bacterium CG_4_8_14_3_um_filter_42_11 TaxID=1975076 RepID=A0A2M8G6N7_UNCKA|nr:MAG: hypothetical protein CO015_03275 [candidate division WWE3 bacterium CG_4_8_14_3_um_filter_42_11]
MNKKRAIFLLIFAGIAIYSLSLFNGFVWDDEEQVVNNTLVHTIANLPSFFTGSTFNTGGTGTLMGIYYKPLMSFFFALIYTFFGPQAFFFHLFQVGIHILNSVLVFWLFRSFLVYLERSKNSKLKTSAPADPPSSRWNDWLAFSLALLFLVHPIQVEAVVYVSALQDVLFFCFGMLSLRAIAKNQNNLRLFLLPAILFLLSLFSKETAAVLILLTLVFVLLFKKGKLLFSALAAGGAVLIYAFLRFVVAKVFFFHQDFSPIMQAPLPQRLLSIPKIIFVYLKTFFFPDRLAIAQHWVVVNPNFPDFFGPLAFDFLFFAVLVVCGIWLYQHSLKAFKTYLFFFLWFVFGLVLHLQLFPLDLTLAERWFYLPLVGLLGMLGIVVYSLKCKKVLVLLLLACALPLATRAISRTTDWKNGLTLFSRDIAISHDVFDLENNYGVELFRAGQYDEAKAHFEKSTAVAPNWWTNWNNLGASLEREGNLISAAQDYQKAIANGDYYLAYENYAGILAKQEKYEEAKEFLENKALPKFPLNYNLQQMYLYVKFKLQPPSDQK